MLYVRGVANRAILRSGRVNQFVNALPGRARHDVTSVRAVVIGARRGGPLAPPTLSPPAAHDLHEHRPWPETTSAQYARRRSRARSTSRGTCVRVSVPLRSLPPTPRGAGAHHLGAAPALPLAAGSSRARTHTLIASPGGRHRRSAVQVPALRRPVRAQVRAPRATHYLPLVLRDGASDLLSRHINKCHAAEKPPVTSAPNQRRKGAAAACRATTSKQACDQCVTGTLPCDGANPCCECPSHPPSSQAHPGTGAMTSCATPDLHRC
jgi:hypothetical protein